MLVLLSTKLLLMELLLKKRTMMETIPPTLYAKINNSKELAVKNAVEEIGGTYEAALVPPETPNDEVFALVSARRATWRQQLDTLLKPSERIDSDDEHGAVQQHTTALVR